VNKRTSNLIFSMITSFILAPKCLGSRTTFFSRRTWKNIFLRFWIRIYTSLLYSLSALSVCVCVCVTTLSPLFFLARVRSRLSCSLLLLLLLDERERERERECARGEKSLQRSGEFLETRIGKKLFSDFSAKDIINKHAYQMQSPRFSNANNWRKLLFVAVAMSGSSMILFSKSRREREFMHDALKADAMRYEKQAEEKKRRMGELRTREERERHVREELERKIDGRVKVLED